MQNGLWFPPLILSLSLAPPFFNLKPTGQKVENFAGFFFHREVKGNTEYLLMFHAKQKQWGVPGGQLELGETVFEGALRETWEETGWAYQDDYKADFENEMHFNYKKENGIWRQVHLWPATLTNSKKSLKISEEHSEYAWMEYEEALNAIQKEYRPALVQCDTLVHRAK